MTFNPNKRGAYPVVRSQWPGYAPQTLQERRETIYAVLAVGCVLAVSGGFLLAWLLTS
jgi:hypothetical protein